ncbi:MAG: hypothetical protein QOE70_2303 [Chthoniobacter sp.]|jgi:hypothetical protein|nr:hypothetical protein [Chthoniobacter sp.]
MKRSSAFLICVLALFSNACEQHKASELEGRHGLFSEMHPPSADHPAKATHEEKKSEAEKPGEAPKFFPEKK